MKLILFCVFISLVGCVDNTSNSEAVQGNFRYTKISGSAERYVDEELGIACYHISSGVGCASVKDDYADGFGWAHVPGTPAIYQRQGSDLVIHTPSHYYYLPIKEWKNK